MAFMIAATKAAAPVTVHQVDVDVSYPGFFETLERLTAQPVT
jgi:5-enolpyruvylshikimate-3-phosphate synthase